MPAVPIAPRPDRLTNHRTRHDSPGDALDRRLGPGALERLVNLWDWLRTSLWFVPAIMLGLTLLLVLMLRSADAVLNAANLDPPLLYSSPPGEAIELLSTLLSSMITMVSLVFSITMVVLTLAANQFGSRLIRTFMADRKTQVALGSFVAIILYCLLAVVQVRHDQPVPRLSVTAAILLAIYGIFLLLFFIHSIARSIVAETVIERVGRELDHTIERLLPIDRRGEIASAEQAADVMPDDFAACARAIALKRTGYVQAVEYKQLVRLAVAHDVVLLLRFRAGDYVIEDGLRIFLHPADRFVPPITDAIDGALLIGHSRTPTQDIEFAIRHLVEIALRALSPSLNDSYTATAVIDRLGASLARLMGRTLQPEVHYDKAGRPRVLGEAPTYAGIFAAAFHQIRQAARPLPAVIIRLLSTITRVAEHARLGEQREALLHHVRMIAEDGVRHAGSAADAADIRAAEQTAERTLRQPPGTSAEERAKAEWFS